jgi:hypothetical protein
MDSTRLDRFCGFTRITPPSGQPKERDVSGLTDPRFRFSLNLYGAPASSVKEFADYRQDLIVGASVYVWAPWGQYDSTKVINLGTNRWSFKTEVGFSKALGAWTFEVIPAVTFFAENSNYLDGNTRTQDPIYSVQAHVIYHLSSGIWMALDGTYYTGGQTHINGVSDADRESNSRAGVTLALPVDRYNSLKLYASTGVSTRTGSNFNTFGVAWQYRLAEALQNSAAVDFQRAEHRRPRDRCLVFCAEERCRAANALSIWLAHARNASSRNAIVANRRTPCFGPLSRADQPSASMETPRGSLQPSTTRCMASVTCASANRRSPD